MSEPLLKLADAVGGQWPVRIRAALVSLFQEESAFDRQQAWQLLADLRDCFAYHGYPQRLSTATFLAWMHSLPARPWDVDGPLTARTLAQTLVAFEIRPRVQRLGSANPGLANPGLANPGSDNPARGYQLQDFLEPWQAHLGFNIPSGKPAAAEPASSLVTHDSQSEIPNKDTGCNAVTDSGMTAANAPAAQSVDPLVTDGSPSEIPNKDTGCNTVTDSGTIRPAENPAEELPDSHRIPPQRAVPDVADHLA